MISLLIDSKLSYPEPGEGFSPDEKFPEYRFEQISTGPNLIYRAVRNVFLQAGLDREHFGTPFWNPLGGWIHPGDHVFVLCNFANERRSDEEWINYRARCTHGSVIRAAIDYILIALEGEGEVKFGNAPTQFCHWEQVLKDTDACEVERFYNNQGQSITACDLRLFVNDSSSIGAVKSVERREEGEGVHVDLDGDSLLSELDQVSPQRYRVMNYDPRRTSAFHNSGRHEYVINQQILRSDVIFSIPKLKTHEKVGISCVLKGYVGTVAHKDSLPHHRYGSPNEGGDEYPDSSKNVVRLASAFHERIQQVQPDSFIGSVSRVSFRLIKHLIHTMAPVIEGAWWGNDTAWRMVLALVRIAFYCNSDGKMQALPVRRHLALIDGIYGGEGEGPAYPTAVNCGVLAFGDNLPAVDVLNALIMGFDPEEIPLVRESYHLTKYPLSVRDLSLEEVFFNGKQTLLDDFHQSSLFHFKPSDGWRERLSNNVST
jgi:uncharacterized protein (DUF362 family)